MSSRTAKGLYQSGVEQGANPHDDWFGTFEAAQRSAWVAIEVFQNDVWVNVLSR
jgi:hypothetical protein